MCKSQNVRTDVVIQNLEFILIIKLKRLYLYFYVGAPTMFGCSINCLLQKNAF